MELNLKVILKNYGILIAFFAICVIISILSPVFLAPNNIINVIRQTSIYGIIAVGMTFVILTGGIDLSVGSILAVSGAVCAGLIHAQLPVAAVIAAALGVGIAFGVFNGLFITLGKITPFVVTLGMMGIARGITLIYTNGYPISGLPEDFRFVGSGYLFGLPIPVLIFIAVVLVAHFVLTQTRMGRYTYAIGGNEAAVRLSGINANFYKALAYVIAGATAGLSSVILTARLNSAEPVAGNGYELDVIAAVVIGGTSLSGGRGSIWGTFIGALMIGVINNGMNLLGISSYFQLVVKGFIIIGAVWLDRLRDESN
jgi:ribose transport system permease protein